MAEDECVERALYGGAISMTLPLRFQDLSNVREVPDHQEAFGDPSRDESIIIEVLEWKQDVGDEASAAWFLKDLAREQDAQDDIGFCRMHLLDGVVYFLPLNGALSDAVMSSVIFRLTLSIFGFITICCPELIEPAGVLESPRLCYRSMPAVVTNAVGQMAISKGRQGREAKNILRVYLANLRLKEVGTDLLITAYEPTVINPLSESAGIVGAGVVEPAEQAGYMPMAEVFKQSVNSFRINDWSLFNA